MLNFSFSLHSRYILSETCKSQKHLEYWADFWIFKAEETICWKQGGAGGGESNFGIKNPISNLVSQILAIKHLIFRSPKGKKKENEVVLPHFSGKKFCVQILRKYYFKTNLEYVPLQTIPTASETMFWLSG